MRHGLKGRKFYRTGSHNKALIMNLARSLVKYEQIITTLPKAKELRPFIERMITLGKKGGLHRRRKVISTFGEQELVSKIMDVFPTRYSERTGGYSRIIRNGFRRGDRAPMAVIELVDRDESAKIFNKVDAEPKEAQAN